MGKPTFDHFFSDVSPHRLRKQFQALDKMWSDEGILLLNKIGGFKQTQGTETSKYLEERISTKLR